MVAKCGGITKSSVLQPQVVGLLHLMVHLLVSGQTQFEVRSGNKVKTWPREPQHWRAGLMETCEMEDP